MWQKLSDAERRQHELNNFQGWLLVVILLNCLVIILSLVLIWVVISFRDPEFDMAVAGRPIMADISVLVFGMMSGVVCLFAIWTRQYRTPEIYLGATALVVLTQIMVEMIWSDPEYSLYTYALIAILNSVFVVPPILYLYLGKRPNVMFRLRVRDAP